MTQGVQDVSRWKPQVALPLNDDNLVKHTQLYDQLDKKRDFVLEYIEGLDPTTAPEGDPEPPEANSLDTPLGSSSHESTSSSRHDHGQRQQTLSKNKRKRLPKDKTEAHPQPSYEDSNTTGQVSSAVPKGKQSRLAQDNDRDDPGAKGRQSETKSTPKRQKQLLDIDTEIENLDINKSGKGSRQSNGHQKSRPIRVATSMFIKDDLNDTTGMDRMRIL